MISTFGRFPWFAALLSLHPLAALAEWTRLSESFASTLYVDTATVRKLPGMEKGGADEDLREAVEMIDFKLKAPNGPSSYISTGQYDCRNRRMRYSSGHAYAGPAGTGQVLTPVTPSDWTHLPADTLAPAFTFVCTMKLDPGRSNSAGR